MAGRVGEAPAGLPGALEVDKTKDGEGAKQWNCRRSSRSGAGQPEFESQPCHAVGTGPGLSSFDPGDPIHKAGHAKVQMSLPEIAGEAAAGNDTAYGLHQNGLLSLASTWILLKESGQCEATGGKIVGCAVKQSGFSSCLCSPTAVWSLTRAEVSPPRSSDS